MTLTDNTANFDNFGSAGGGGIAAVSFGTSMANTLVAGNSDLTLSDPPDPDCTGMLGSSGYNLLGSVAGCTFTPETGDQAGVASFLLGPLASNGGPTKTHALLSGSPALNAAYPGSGSGVPCPPADQRGVPRPREGRCDIGAYEFDPPPVTNPPPPNPPATPVAPKRCKKGQKLKKGRCVKKKKKRRKRR